MSGAGGKRLENNMATNDVFTASEDNVAFVVGRDGAFGIWVKDKRPTEDLVVLNLTPNQATGLAIALRYVALAPKDVCIKVDIEGFTTGIEDQADEG